MSAADLQGAGCRSWARVCRLSSSRDAIYGGLETLSTAVCAVRRIAPAGAGAVRASMQMRSKRARAQRLTDLARAANEPTRVALDRWYAEAFPGHPYGRSVGRHARDRSRGSPLDDLKAHARATCFARDVLQIVIVGDIDKRAAADALDAHIRWPSGEGENDAASRRSTRVPCRRRWSSTRTIRSPRRRFGLPSLRSDRSGFRRAAGAESHHRQRRLRLEADGGNPRQARLGLFDPDPVAARFHHVTHGRRRGNQERGDGNDIGRHEGRIRTTWLATARRQPSSTMPNAT